MGEVARYSEYVVYVDESGDHGLSNIDPEYPIFALSFCVVRQPEYIHSIVPMMQALNFKYWGHDAVVFHEHEIRKTIGDFAFLRADKMRREQFLEDLNALMEKASFTIISAVIRKPELAERYRNPWNPYELAMYFCLERLVPWLSAAGQDGTLTHVIFECRGAREDAELELAFRRIVDGSSPWGMASCDFSVLELEPKFAKKSVNSTGLQLADLTARPIGLGALRPHQSNRARTIIQGKLHLNKIFP